MCLVDVTVAAEGTIAVTSRSGPTCGAMVKTRAEQPHCGVKGVRDHARALLGDKARASARIEKRRNHFTFQVDGEGPLEIPHDCRPPAGFPGGRAEPDPRPASAWWRSASTAAWHGPSSTR